MITLKVKNGIINGLFPIWIWIRYYRRINNVNIFIYTKAKCFRAQVNNE